MKWDFLIFERTFCFIYASLVLCFSSMAEPLQWGSGNVVGSTGLKVVNSLLVRESRSGAADVAGQTRINVVNKPLSNLIFQF